MWDMGTRNAYDDVKERPFQGAVGPRRVFGKAPRGAARGMAPLKSECVESLRR